MKPEKYIIYSVYIWVFFYLAFAFVLADINAMQWKQENRAAFIFLCTVVNMMMITYPRYNKS
jgi:hypothetical protein